MNSVSIEALEQKIDAGEEVIDDYFDLTTTHVGTPRVISSRRQSSDQTVQLPSSILNELDLMASELDISRQAVINMMLRRALDEHYLAKKSA